MPPQKEAWCQVMFLPVNLGSWGKTIPLLSGGDGAGRDAHRDIAGKKREYIYVFTALSIIYKAHYFVFKEIKRNLP